MPNMKNTVTRHHWRQNKTCFCQRVSFSETKPSRHTSKHGCVSANGYVANNGHVAANGYAAAKVHVAANGYVAANVEFVRTHVTLTPAAC